VETFTWVITSDLFPVALIGGERGLGCTVWLHEVIQGTTVHETH